MRVVKTFFTRNRNIVDASDALVAFPGETRVRSRGGTSFTIGYARKVRKPLYIVWPDGSVTRENLGAEK